MYTAYSRQQIMHPLIQLERTSYLFKEMLQLLKIDMEVIPYIVFTNEQFMLYSATLKHPFIFPQQLKRFLQKINANVETINQHTQKIANLLLSKRKEKSAFEQLPEYALDELKRGVFVISVIQN